MSEKLSGPSWSKTKPAAIRATLIALATQPISCSTRFLPPLVNHFVSTVATGLLLLHGALDDAGALLFEGRGRAEMHDARVLACEELGLVGPHRVAAYGAVLGPRLLLRLQTVEALVPRAEALDLLGAPGDLVLAEHAPVGKLGRLVDGLDVERLLPGAPALTQRSPPPAGGRPAGARRSLRAGPRSRPRAAARRARR